MSSISIGYNWRAVLRHGGDCARARPEGKRKQRRHPPEDPTHANLTFFTMSLISFSPSLSTFVSGYIRLEAGVDRLLRPANFALDFAAPVESAGAPLDHLLHLRLVASATAHEVAAVDADRRLVADSTLRAGDAQLEVLLAEVGRVLVVDQVLLGRRLVLRIVRLQLVVVLLATVAWCPAGVADEDAGRSVESVLKVVADNAEEGQTHPASAHRTGSAHAVTLALLSHFRGNVL